MMAISCYTGMVLKVGNLYRCCIHKLCRENQAKEPIADLILPVMLDFTCYVSEFTHGQVMGFSVTYKRY